MEYRGVDVHRDQAFSGGPAPDAPVRAGIPDHGRIPKYYDVASRLAAMLDELGEGGTLPTERDLATRFEVSRATIRRALSDLLLQGRVRRYGRSTVVAGPKLEQPMSLMSSAEGMRWQGEMPSRSLIGLDRLPAGPALGAQLRIAASDPVWHVERLLLADDERVGLESLYVPVERFPDLQRDSEPGSPFHRYVRDRLGVRFATANEKIETVLASPREALLIGTPSALPMLLLHRISYDSEGSPVERVRSLYRGDRFSFTTQPATDTSLPYATWS
ncbi:GntR family transcriptional regulator [Streptomyces sp. NPDC020800]|uniref:GntR family transcriptional regulator n=1 Tax=Streptomyces sp. NPDC020800 TaxID=3365092 RepID=UPI0037B6C96F